MRWLVIDFSCHLLWFYKLWLMSNILADPNSEKSHPLFPLKCFLLPELEIPGFL